MTLVRQHGSFHPHYPESLGRVNNVVMDLWQQRVGF